MKKLLKIIAYFFVVLIGLILLLGIVLKLSENKISDFALKKVSEIIKAPISIDDVNFNLLRKFPHASVELSKVYLGNAKDSLKITKQNSDSLLFIDKIYVSINTRSLLKKKYEIEDVELSGLTLSYFVNEVGKSNFDFLIPKDTTPKKEKNDTLPSTILDILLGNLTLSDITLHYKDLKIDAGAKVFIPKINIKGKVYDTIYSGKVNGAVVLTNCNYQNYKVNLMEKTQLAFDIAYQKDSVSLTNIQLGSDGLDINVNGKAALKDSIFVDLGLNLSKIDLGELIKYVPDTLLQQFGIQQVKGNLNISSKIKGYYKDSTLLPRVDANITLLNGNIVTTEYPEVKNITIKGFVSNGNKKNNTTTTAKFEQISISTPKSSVNLAFDVKNIDNPNYWLKSNIFLDTDELTNFIPDSTVEYLTGKIKIALETKGTLPKDLGINSAEYFMDRTKLDLEMKNISTALDTIQKIKNLSLKFSYRPSRQINLTNLSMEAPAYQIALKNSYLKAKILGKVNDIDHMGADIQAFNFAFGKSAISGKAYLKNTKKPNFKINSDVKLYLADLQPFIHDTLAKQIQGNIHLAVNSFGKIDLDSVATQAIPIAFEQTKLTLNAKDIRIKEALNNKKMNIDNFDLDMSLANDTLLINKFFVDMLNTKMSIHSTEITNLYKTFIQERKDTQLIVQTHIKIDSVNYDIIQDFLASLNENNKEKNSDTDKEKDTKNTDNESVKDTLKQNNEPKYLLPDLATMGLPHFLIRGDLAINYIKYQKNIIDDLSTKFRFADSLYVLDEFKLKTCDGKVNTSVMLDARNWKYPKVDIRNYITDLNLQQLLKNNDNFGDTTLTYDKVSGLLTSELHGRAFFEGDSLVQELLKAKGNFTLKNGKLYNYPPLAEISKSMKIFGGLEELDKLDFNTLKTSIFLYKNEIYIPKTDVVTSSLDFSAFAMQDLSKKGYYEYHLLVHLGDVLMGKSKKLMEKQAEQNKKEEDKVERKGLELVAISLADKKKYGFDNSSLKAKFKNNLNVQHGFLNLLFNPMLVNFSTDLDRTARNKKILEKYKNNKK